jgi:hypothetical protein
MKELISTSQYPHYNDQSLKLVTVRITTSIKTHYLGKIQCLFLLRKVVNTTTVL